MIGFAAPQPAHRITIPTQAGPIGYSHLARCSCGWIDSISRRSLTVAQDAADHHIASVTGQQHER